MNVYNPANRIASFLEAVARYLLSSSALAWLLYAGALAAFGPGPNGERAGLLLPVLAISLLLPIPLFWLLSRRVAQTMGRLWESCDRSSRPVLLAMRENIDARALLLGRGKAADFRRWLLRALVDLAPGEHSAQSTRLLYDLALGTAGVDHNLLREAAIALGKAEGGRASGALRLWNLSAARGGTLDPVLVGDTITRALQQPLPRRPRPLLPVLASALRGSWGEAELFLLALLKAGRLAPRHLQPDLRRVLAASPECPPALRRDLDPGRERRLQQAARVAERAVAPAAASAAHASTSGPREGAPAAAPVTARGKRRSHWSLPEFGNRQAWVQRGMGLAVILVAIMLVRILPGLKPQETEDGGLSASSPVWRPPDDAQNDKSYTVQVMATKDSLIALNEGKRLRRKGYWSYVLGPRENSQWYRVRMGWFGTRSEADSVAAALLADGIIRDRYTANFENESMLWNPDSLKGPRP
ncbi:MAG: SPOR domain-containing protein [Candidatus Delongbacteria bacterium]|nr:SPOR domain-containing protein [Candidatus Delongbacteria bacterium]